MSHSSAYFAAGSALMGIPKPKQAGETTWTATSFYTNRSDEDQYQVQEMAKRYFAQHTLEYLRGTLGKDTLAFDSDELVNLLRMTAAMRDNMALQHTVPIEKFVRVDEVSEQDGILQFYDFCLTVDALKNVLRLFHSQLTNVPNLPEESFKQIEKEVFYPDFIPAFVREDGQKYPQDEKSIAGYRLNGPDKTRIVNGNFVLEPKKHIDLAVCEAVLLSSGIFNTHQALTQGLFVVHGTTAQKLALPVDVKKLKELDGILTDTYIEPGRWINTFDSDVLQFYSTSNQETGFYILSATADTYELYSGSVYPCATPILQPKFVDYAAYRRYMTMPRSEAAGGIFVNDRKIASNEEGAPVQPHQTQGGAIGVHIDHWDVVEELPQFAFTNDRNNAVLGLRVTERDIFLAMSRLSFHPISSCPKLSRAYKESGTANQVLQMIETLQQVLFAQARKRISTSATKAFSIDTLNEQKSASGGYIPHCGPGFTAQFYRKGENGQYVPVPEEEALVSRDGNLELASHVARDHIECVPRVTVAQLGGKFSTDNLAYHPVVVREMRDPADIRVKAPPSSYPAQFEYKPDIVSEFGDFARYLVK